MFQKTFSTLVLMTTVLAPAHLMAQDMVFTEDALEEEPPPPAAEPRPAEPRPTEPRPAEPPAGAWADKGGAFGFGFDGTLGGTVGFHGRYFPTDSLGLQGTLGFSNSSTTRTPAGGMGEATTSTTVISLGFTATLKVVEFSEGHLSLLGGVDIGSTSGSRESGGVSNDVSFFAFGLSIGLFAELFLDDFLSVHGQTGLRMAFGSGDLSGLDTSTFSLSTANDLVTAFGFTFWL